MTEISNNPVDTQSRLNVYKTSTRRYRHRVNVLQALKQRVSTGQHPQQTFNNTGTPQGSRTDMLGSYSVEQPQRLILCHKPY